MLSRLLRVTRATSWALVLLLLLLPGGSTQPDDATPDEEEQAVLHPLARKLYHVGSTCTKTSSDKANIGVFYTSRQGAWGRHHHSRPLTRYCFTLTSNALRGPNGGKPCSSPSPCCDKKLFRTLTDFTLFTDKACDRKQLSWLVWRIGYTVLSHKDSMSDGSTRVKLGSAWRTSQTTTQLCVDIPSAMRCNTLEKLCGAKGCQYTLQTPFVKKSHTSISCCINGLMPYTCPLGYGAVDAGYSCVPCPCNTYADGSAKAPPLRPCTRCPPRTFVAYQGAKSITECRPIPPPPPAKCTQPPPAITGVNWPWPNCGTTGTCSGSCAEGYSGGPVTVVCNNGVWTTPTGQCTANPPPVQECTQPPPAITGVTWPNCGTTGTCIGSCASGYSGGPVTVVCNKGVWSNPTGQCVQECTQAPPAITGVNWPWPSCGSSGTCSGSCASGYSGGPVTVVCNNGVWTTPTGQCTANPPPVQVLDLYLRINAIKFVPENALGPQLQHMQHAVFTALTSTLPGLPTTVVKVVFVHQWGFMPTMDILVKVTLFAGRGASLSALQTATSDANFMPRVRDAMTATDFQESGSGQVCLADANGACIGPAYLITFITSCPVDVCFLIDGSTRLTDKQYILQGKVIDAMIKLMGTDTESYVSVVEFGSTALNLIGPRYRQSISAESYIVGKRLNSPTADVALGLARCSLNLRGNGQNPNGGGSAIVLLSAGVFDDTAGARAAAQQEKDRGIYIVTVGVDKDVDTLRDLSSDGSVTLAVDNAVDAGNLAAKVAPPLCKIKPPSGCAVPPAFTLPAGATAWPSDCKGPNSCTAPCKPGYVGPGINSQCEDNRWLEPVGFCSDPWDLEIPFLQKSDFTNLDVIAQISMTALADSYLEQLLKGVYGSNLLESHAVAADTVRNGKSGVFPDLMPSTLRDWIIQDFEQEGLDYLTSSVSVVDKGRLDDAFSDSKLTRREFYQLRNLALIRDPSRVIVVKQLSNSPMAAKAVYKGLSARDAPVSSSDFNTGGTACTGTGVSQARMLVDSAYKLTSTNGQKQTAGNLAWFSAKSGKPRAIDFTAMNDENPTARDTSAAYNKVFQSAAGVLASPGDAPVIMDLFQHRVPLPKMFDTWSAAMQQGSAAALGGKDDWEVAVGEYRIWGQARVSAKGVRDDGQTGYSMSLTLYLNGAWRWYPSTNPGFVVQEEDMHNLHVCGDGQEFELQGEDDVRSEWWRL